MRIERAVRADAFWLSKNQAPYRKIRRLFSCVQKNIELVKKSALFQCEMGILCSHILNLAAFLPWALILSLFLPEQGRNH